MKKYFLLLFLYFISPKTFSQDLPKYYIVNRDTLGIILSIDQVKKIKNDLELKTILEDMKISCDSAISKYIVVVDDYEKKILSLKRTIGKMDTTDINSQKLIGSINKELSLAKTDLRLCDSIRVKQDSVMKNDETIISDLKCKRNLGYGGTILFFITTLIFLAL
jgi:hypothetical protein